MYRLLNAYYAIATIWVVFHNFGRLFKSLGDFYQVWAYFLSNHLVTLRTFREMAPDELAQQMGYITLAFAQTNKTVSLCQQALEERGEGG